MHPQPDVRFRTEPSLSRACYLDGDSLPGHCCAVALPVRLHLGVRPASHQCFRSVSAKLSIVEHEMSSYYSMPSHSKGFFAFLRLTDWALRLLRYALPRRSWPLLRPPLVDQRGSHLGTTSHDSTSHCMGNARTEHGTPTLALPLQVDCHDTMKKSHPVSSWSSDKKRARLSGRPTPPGAEQGAWAPLYAPDPDHHRPVRASNSLVDSTEVRLTRRYRLKQGAHDARQTHASR